MPDPAARPSLLDRALVLAVADAEHGGERWLDSAPAPGDIPDDDDRAIIARARRLAAESDLDGEVRRALRVQRVVWSGAVVLGILAGASAAWAGLAGGGDPTSPTATDLNVLWFLQATLGLHTLFFVISIVAMAMAVAGVGHPLLAAARTGAATAARAARGVNTATRAAAMAAFGGRRGALAAGALGHAGGLGFIAGAVVALLVAASFREQYQFFWKSTLLSDAQAAGLIDAVAAGPRATGVPTPSLEQIRAARGGVGVPEAAETARWAWMLIGALIVWGAVPRALALSVCLLGAGIATSRSPLPISASYQRRALERERRRVRETHAAGPAPSVSPPPPPSPEEDDRPLGEPALLGYEIDRDAPWPPAGLGGCVDLGLIDGAADRRRAMQRLDEGATRPRVLAAFFSRGETPAEAERQFIRRLVARAGDRVAVVLTLSRSLATEREARDAERIAHRTRLWRQAAAEAGVRPDRVLEIDLHHATAKTLQRLRGFVLGDETVARPHSDHAALERSLDEIEAWAAGNDHTRESLAALLRAIDARFEARPAWRRAATAVSSGDLRAAGEIAAESARSLARVLPGWMPRHAGWMTATATLVTTGTLAAVTIAGGPIGIVAGAWPLYAAAGAALGEAFGRGADAVRPEPPRDEELVVAGARASVLHALVLALQGLPDERVAREIDRILAGSPEVTGREDVAGLTEHVRGEAGRLAEAEGHNA